MTGRECECRRSHFYILDVLATGKLLRLASTILLDDTHRNLAVWLHHGDKERSTLKIDMIQLIGFAGFDGFTCIVIGKITDAQGQRRCQIVFGASGIIKVSCMDAGPKFLHQCRNYLEQ